KPHAADITATSANTASQLVFICVKSSHTTRMTRAAPGPRRVHELVANITFRLSLSDRSIHHQCCDLQHHSQVPMSPPTFQTTRNSNGHGNSAHSWHSPAGDYSERSSSTWPFSADTTCTAAI